MPAISENKDRWQLPFPGVYDLSLFSEWHEEGKKHLAGAWDVKATDCLGFSGEGHPYKLGFRGQAPSFFQDLPSHLVFPLQMSVLPSLIEANGCQLPLLTQPWGKTCSTVTVLFCGSTSRPYCRQRTASAKSELPDGGLKPHLERHRLLLGKLLN